MSDRRAPGWFALVALAVAFAIAGCAQEGKLIQTPLPIHGVAADFQIVAQTDAESATDTVHTHTINVTFKISVHARNACEARHALLELRRIENPQQPDSTTFQIIPIARYPADDRCVQDPGGELDTVITLKVNGLILGRTSKTSYNQFTRFTFFNSGATDFVFHADSLVTVHGPAAVGFRVWAQGATGAALPGATVAVDRFDPGGVATPLDSSVTGADGFAEFSFPVTPTSPADTSDVPFMPYRVRVTSGASTRILSSPSFPARLYRYEKIQVRI